jgi:hypothetical protein
VGANDFTTRHKPLAKLSSRRMTTERADARGLTTVARQFRTCAFCGTMYEDSKYATECELDAERELTKRGKRGSQQRRINKRR